MKTSWCSVAHVTDLIIHSASLQKSSIFLNNGNANIVSNAEIVIQTSIITRKKSKMGSTFKIVTILSQRILVCVMSAGRTIIRNCPATFVTIKPHWINTESRKPSNASHVVTILILHVPELMSKCWNHYSKKQTQNVKNQWLPLNVFISALNASSLANL